MAKILTNTLKDKDPKIRISAAKALGEIGNEDAIKPLSTLLADDNWNVRKMGEQSLNKINPKWMDLL